MKLASRSWKSSYRHEDGDLVRLFYVPALERAVSYDRMTGYFSATALSLAARGLDRLIMNQGRMRLIVGCTLEPRECDAMTAGYAFREDPSGYFASEVAKKLAHIEFTPPSENARHALGSLAWLIATNLLDVRVAVPVDPETGAPADAPSLYHEKVGIITDLEGNRLSFSGSINETESGWKHNRESFHVYCSWLGGREEEHVADEVEAFGRVWEGRARSIRTVDFPEAAKQRMLEFLPKDDRFVRPPAKELEEQPVDEREILPQEAEVAPVVAGTPRYTPSEVREIVWTYLRCAAALPNGVRVGEATSAVTPWPHQLRAFKRMWDAWPMRMLEASEVGLGKTTIAGLVLRQLWLSRRAKRVLILVPAAVIDQWVSELYEKFGLLVPVYDGAKLVWRAVPGYVGPQEKRVGRGGWLEEPIVLASSHLMRRKDRAEDLLSCEAGWDLVILDEAHHARRRGAGSKAEKGPNALLRLMQDVAKKAPSLLLLTATPLQVHPVEVYDLLQLLGLPETWNATTFQQYFEKAAQENPSNDDLAWLAGMFQAHEAMFGEVTEDEVASVLGGPSKLTQRKALSALRAKGTTIPIKQLDAKARAAARATLQRFSPVRARMSRFTRALLRRYHEAGLIQATVARRRVRDHILEMSTAERELYAAVEDYIATTYNAAAAKEKNAVGFILTVYRRRLASSVQALRKTLLRRLEGVEPFAGAEDVSQDQLRDEAMSAEEAKELADQSLHAIEARDIKELLKRIERVGIETKARRLAYELEALFAANHDSAIVFTMYTDTMEGLAEYLAEALPNVPIGTYSGAGGRFRDRGGTWTTCSKEHVKLGLKNKRIRVLVATDAAGEGLNLQFCGVVANYDLPWNPMKVEQRIGRIDRIGQVHPEIEILNFGYKDTVEADVYQTLGERIHLFEGIVGKLQPILSKLPGRIEAEALASREHREANRQRFLADLASDVEVAKAAAFDIDEVSADDLYIPSLPSSPVTPEDLEALMQWEEAMPPGWRTRALDPGSFGVGGPGVEEVRATPRPGLFDDHPESMAFFTLGAPVVELARSQAVGDQDVECGDVLHEALAKLGSGDGVQTMAQLLARLRGFP